MAKSSRQYLDLRGLKYWFKRDIPAAVRPQFGGKTAYLVNLETGDIRAAMQRRDEIKRQTDRLFRDAREGRSIGTVTDIIQDRAEAWAKEIAEARSDPEGWTAKITGREREHISEEDVHDPHELVEAEAERLAESHGTEGRDRFLNLVQGNVDVEHHMEAYLKEAKLAPKTTDERRNLIKRFAAWAKLKGLSLRQIDRAKAGTYFTEAIAPLNEKTAKKHYGSVKLYWDYLIARGHVRGTNPWEGQRLPDRGRRVERGGQQEERPFAEAEIKTLLYSPFPDGMSKKFQAQLHDAMRIAALSGMRLAEIVTLWVEECPIGEDGTGYFDVRQGKTAAAARRVPIHPDLLEIIQRRTKDKAPTDWLFHELADQRDPGDTFGKRFAAYRGKLKVDDTRPGQRRSLVNFHSFRRWFVTEAERAGIPESTISSIVGHEEGRKSITFGVYSGGPAWQQMRGCVEAVELPKR
jgi:integrase